MRQSVQGRVAVITGASSGIGRATALEFARRGAHVVLAARREEPLTELAGECAQLGVRAVVVPADVADEGAVATVAQRAIELFGRLDVWVNNAAVSHFAPFDRTSLEDFRRVMETNFYGYVHGARAALHNFSRQGRGVLINVGSLASLLAEPYVSAYVASKHAIRGLAQSLRQELFLRGERAIHVCTVLPATVDTPFFQHAGSEMGHLPKAMPPVYAPEQVARTIVRLAQRPRREVFVGGSLRPLYVLSVLAPKLVERTLARMAEREFFLRERRLAPTRGNLYRPVEEGTSASGGWRARGANRPLRAVGFGALAATPLLVWGLMRLPARLAA